MAFEEDLIVRDVGMNIQALDLFVELHCERHEFKEFLGPGKKLIVRDVGMNIQATLPCFATMS